MSEEQNDKKVYIAGDWLAPPIEMADRLEKAGYTIIAKWWKDRVAHKANVALLMEEIRECDLFIFDMRSDRFEKHKFGGSHIGTGIALALGKEVKVILPKNAAKPLTALLAPFVTKDENDLFDDAFLEAEHAGNQETDV